MSIVIGENRNRPLSHIVTCNDKFYYVNSRDTFELEHETIVFECDVEGRRIDWNDLYVKHYNSHNDMEMMHLYIIEHLEEFIGEQEGNKKMDKLKIHKEICEKMHETYKAKNADYGDSFSKTRAEYPEAICIRLSDKLERLKTLINNDGQQVKDESIEDTLLDIADYAVMELVERICDKAKLAELTKSETERGGINE